jgi:FMN-dependent NADH-azoreductase
MTKVLIIRSSAALSHAVSNGLVDAYKADYAKAHPDATIIDHDFGANPLPVISGHNISGLGPDPQTPEAKAFVETSDALVAELIEADYLIIGSPMYNLGISALLKTWLDYVTRAGKTFKYTENGPAGLLPAGKKALVIATRGGFYSEGPAAGYDHQVPHLKSMLMFLGITDIEIVYAESLNMGPEPKAEAITQATAKLKTLV